MYQFLQDKFIEDLYSQNTELSKRFVSYAKEIGTKNVDLFCSLIGISSFIHESRFMSSEDLGRLKSCLKDPKKYLENNPKENKNEKEKDQFDELAESLKDYNKDDLKNYFEPLIISINTLEINNEVWKKTQNYKDDSKCLRKEDKFSSPLKRRFSDIAYKKHYKHLSEKGFEFSHVYEFIKNSPSFKKDANGWAAILSALEGIEKSSERIYKEYLNSGLLYDVDLKKDLDDFFSSLELHIATLVQDSLANGENLERNFQSLKEINNDLSEINSSAKESAAENIKTIYNRVYSDPEDRPSDKEKELGKCSNHIDLIMKMSRFEAKQGNDRKDYYRKRANEVLQKYHDESINKYRGYYDIEVVSSFVKGFFYGIRKARIFVSIGRKCISGFKALFGVEQSMKIKRNKIHANTRGSDEFRKSVREVDTKIVEDSNKNSRIYNGKNGQPTFNFSNHHSTGASSRPIAEVFSQVPTFMC